MVLKHPLCHGGSKYVLSFEIGQWEGGFYSGRTNTHRQTDTLGNYNVDYYYFLDIQSLAATKDNVHVIKMKTQRRIGK